MIITLSTTGTRLFHVDHIDLRICMVQKAKSELSEILYYWLVATGDLVSKWARKGSLSFSQCDMLSMAEKKAKFQILLRRNVTSNMCWEHDIVPPETSGCIGIP
jgi:hypothetical protein